MANLLAALEAREVVHTNLSLLAGGHESNARDFRRTEHDETLSVLGMTHRGTHLKCSVWKTLLWCGDLPT